MNRYKQNARYVQFMKRLENRMFATTLVLCCIMVACLVIGLKTRNSSLGGWMAVAGITAAAGIMLCGLVGFTAGRLALEAEPLKDHVLRSCGLILLFAAMCTVQTYYVENPTTFATGVLLFAALTGMLAVIEASTFALARIGNRVMRQYFEKG